MLTAITRRPHKRRPLPENDGTYLSSPRPNYVRKHVLGLAADAVTVAHHRYTPAQFLGLV